MTKGMTKERTIELIKVLSQYRDSLQTSGENHLTPPYSALIGLLKGELKNAT